MAKEMVEELVRAVLTIISAIVTIVKIFKVKEN